MSVELGTRDLATLAGVMLACIGVAATSQVGALLRGLSRSALARWVPRLLALAIGVLASDTLFHLLPHAHEIWQSITPVLLLCIAGLVTMAGAAAIGRRWQGRRPRPLADEASIRIALASDALHNFADGLLIATSFVIDPVMGVATTLTVFAHEIPQELGDLGILLTGERPLSRALRLNLYAALTVFPGALAGLALGGMAITVMAWLAPVIAGGFLYLAFACLLPRLLQEQPPRVNEAITWLGFGVLSTLGAGQLEELALIQTTDSMSPAQELARIVWQYWIGIQ